MKAKSILYLSLATAFAFAVLLAFRVTLVSARSEREYPVATRSTNGSLLFQTSVPTATLQASSGRTEVFKTRNGVSPTQESRVPHLILYENGSLTPAVSRTLYVFVDNISVPPNSAITVTVLAETQHLAPGTTGSTSAAITVWEESWPIVSTQNVTLTLPTLLFSTEFDRTSISGATPTDYFIVNVLIDGKPIRGFPQDHAFLMENQRTTSLFGVGSQRYDLRVYYCDMFIRSGVTRTQVPQMITQSVVPAIQEAFDTIANDWGWGHPHIHTSWDKDGVVETMIGDGSTWFHIQSQGAHWGGGSIQTQKSDQC